MNPITKIEEVYLAKFNLAEYTQFLSSATRYATEATPAKLGISKDFLTSLQGNVEKLTDIIRQSKKSDETSAMLKLDEDRDAKIVYILSTVRNEMKAFLPDRKAAAVSLYNTLRPYVGTQNLPNLQETQVLDSFITNLEKNENAAKILTLGLADVVQMLKADNDAYRQMTDQRAASQTSKLLESSKKVRVQTDAQYDELAARAFAENIASPTPESAEFIQKLNKLIADTKAAYRMRTSRKPGTDNGEAVKMP